MQQSFDSIGTTMMNSAAAASATAAAAAAVGPRDAAVVSSVAGCSRPADNWDDSVIKTHINNNSWNRTRIQCDYDAAVSNK